MAKQKFSQEEFLRNVCGDFFYAGTNKELYTYLWTIKGDGGEKTFQIALTDPTQQELDSWCRKLKKLNVYFSINLLDYKPTSRASANDIACGRCVWLDVDIAGPGHKEKNKLFPNKPLARKWIDSLPLRYSYLVDTGGGYQVYWLLKDTESAAVIANLEAQVIASCKEKLKGYHLDSVQNLDRVFRLPGTKNCKVADKVRQCEIVDYTGNYYTIDEVKAGFKTAGFKSSGVKRRADRPQSLADLPKPAVGLSIDQLRAEIMQIEITDYDVWLRVMAGLHHETSGSDAGLALMIEWSQTDPVVERRSPDNKIREKWLSFRRSGDETLTWSGVRYEYKIKPTGLEALESIADMVAYAEQWSFNPEVISALKERVGKGKKGALTEAIKKRQQQHKVEGVVEEIEKRELVYVTIRGLYHSKSGLLPKSTVNDMVADTATMRAARQQGLLKEVVDVHYMPGKDRFFIGRDGEEYLNSWRPWPMTTEIKLDPKEVERFYKHYHDVFGPDADLLFDWAAYVYQNPGKKLLWAPVLVGDQSIGKTKFIEFMKTSLGAANYTGVTADLFIRDFNDWADHGVMAYIEEVKYANSKDRRTAHEYLKRYISPGELIYHPKFGRVTQVPNHFNFILTSNDIGCLPFTHEERRFAPMVGEMQDGMNADYFSELWGYWGLGDHPSPEAVDRCRAFLLQHKVGKLLVGRAPETLGWAEAAEESQSETEKAVAWVTATDDQVEMNALKIKLSRLRTPEWNPERISNSDKTLSECLRALGFRRKKIGGMKRRWVRKEKAKIIQLDDHRLDFLE